MAQRAPRPALPAHNDGVTEPEANPYHVPLTELERYRPMTAAGRSALDPEDDEDLLPTTTGQIADEPKPRPSMLTVEGEIWAMGQLADYVKSGRRERRLMAVGARVVVAAFLISFTAYVVFQIIGLVTR